MSARLVFYWHNGRSLGHTSRAATIARATLGRAMPARDAWPPMIFSI